MEASFVVIYMVHGENGCDTEVVMVRQFRDKLGRDTIECPGGSTGARREHRL